MREGGGRLWDSMASGDECPVSAEHALFKEKLEVLTSM